MTDLGKKEERSRQTKTKRGTNPNRSFPFILSMTSLLALNVGLGLHPWGLRWRATVSYTYCCWAIACMILLSISSQSSGLSLSKALVASRPWASLVSP